MGLVRKVIVISGKVQKIGFRAEMREIANHYDVKGRVMNLQNGDVKAILKARNIRLKN